MSTLQQVIKKISNGGKLTKGQEETLRKKADMYWDSHPDVDSRFPRWKKNIAWIAGFQLYDYNKYTNTLIEVPLKRKEKLVMNRLRPFVRQLLAKLTADVPQMSVIPKTGENEDIEAARAGDKIVENLADKVNLVEILRSAKLWTIITNRAFLRVFWDMDGSGIIGHEENGDEVTEEGDVSMECVSPFNCRVDPLFNEHDKWRWFIFGEEVDAVALEEEFDLEKGSLDEKSTTLETAFDIESFDTEWGTGGGSGTSAKKEDITGRTVVLKEFWTPDIYALIAGHEVLEYDINPYEEIPFYLIEERLIPISNYEKGMEYNESPIKDAIGIQREFNRMYSLKSTALDRASKLKVLVPFGSMISKKQFTNDYGVFIDYNPKMNAQPHQMRLDPLPAFIETYTNNLEREFEMTFGVREASFGRLPERASHASGTLVNLLLEQDDVLLNPILATINKALAKAWGLALKIVRDNYDVGRLIRYIGENGEYSIEKFRGADLRGNTDVKIVSQSGLPRSRALRIEYIMKLREIGLLTDDKHTLEMLEFGQADKIFQDSLLHTRKAYRENDAIKANPEITPEDVAEWIHPLEEKEAHSVIHARFIFGAEFDRLNPAQQETINKHAMDTVNQISEQQKAAQEEQMVMAERAKALGQKLADEGVAKQMIMDEA